MSKCFQSIKSNWEGIEETQFKEETIIRYMEMVKKDIIIDQATDNFIDFLKHRKIICR